MVPLRQARANAIWPPTMNGTETSARKSFVARRAEVHASPDGDRIERVTLLEPIGPLLGTRCAAELLQSPLTSFPYILAHQRSPGEFHR